MILLPARCLRHVFGDAISINLHKENVLNVKVEQRFAKQRVEKARTHWGF